jgi:catechol 2,3-dioxygenase-like lactoylglutathione lyase family enzyme
MLFHGLSHLEFGVTDLRRSLRLYEEVLGFPVKARGEGFCDLDGHSASLRLLEVQRVERSVSLRVLASDVVAGWRCLVEAGAQPLHEPAKTDLELAGAVLDFDGHRIAVWRELTEDEYDFVPPLPVALSWAPEATQLLQALLTSVPALFRGLARRKVVREVEALCPRGVVTREHVIRGFIRGNSRPTRQARAAPALRAQGIDPALYASDFDE